MNVWRRVYRYGLLVVLLTMASACAPQADDDLAIELRWNGNADLDLMVTVPNGQRITYANPMAGGGTLTTDGQGFCAENGGPSEERITFPGQAERGEYYVTVSYSLACGEPLPITWELTVHNGHEIIHRTGELLPGESVPVGRFLRG